jgi:DnaJ-class molecular chaperone
MLKLIKSALLRHCQYCKGHGWFRPKLTPEEMMLLIPCGVCKGTGRRWRIPNMLNRA